MSDVSCYGSASCQHTGAPDDTESRRWCHDCTEWCYPGDPDMLCVRGLETHLRAEVERLRAEAEHAYGEGYAAAMLVAGYPANRSESGGS